MNGKQIIVELTLSPQQAELLDDLARARQLAVSEAIALALTEWLAKQARLVEARQAMAELSHGLGEGRVHDGARRHDAYLYDKSMP